MVRLSSSEKVMEMGFVLEILFQADEYLLRRSMGRGDEMRLREWEIATTLEGGT